MALPSAKDLRLNPSLRTGLTFAQLLQSGLQQTEAQTIELGFTGKFEKGGAKDFRKQKGFATDAAGNVVDATTGKLVAPTALAEYTGRINDYWMGQFDTKNPDLMAQYPTKIPTVGDYQVQDAAKLERRRRLIASKQASTLKTGGQGVTTSANTTGGARLYGQ
jgi:hypothetical protein